MKTQTKIFIFLLSIILFVSYTYADYMLIVNKSNTNTQITKSELKKIFLGKKTSWSNNKKIVLVVYKKNEIQNEFFKDILKKNETQFSMYWKKAVFTGRGIQPTILKTVKEIKKFIIENPNAIGYIAKEKLDKSLKEIKIVK